MKKRNKRKFLNKIIYTSFLFLITSIFFSRILEFNYSELIKENIVQESLATNKSNLVKYVNGKLEYIGPDIRILEIEPADSFKLTDVVNKRATTGVETVKRTVNNKEYKIEVTHMTMAEFIGKTEQLNGKYDVIVIGRYVDYSLQAPNGLGGYTNNKEGTGWFRDYNGLENDITNKKADEIKDFINSGQLVYIDSEIANTSAYKLGYHFNDPNGNFKKDDIESLDNLIKDKTVNNTNGITITNIIKKYDEIVNTNKALIRTNIISSFPNGDTHDDELGDISKRNMIFNISSNEKIDENVTINLYLDINGDGLFKEEEIVKKVDGVNLSQGQYTLEYNIYEDYPMFIGYLDWRIEVVKIVDEYTEPIKSYFDGNILFRRLTEEKRFINVLQISPFDRQTVINGNKTSESDLNLLTNLKFQDLLKEKVVQDYEINIDVISYIDFYNNENNQANGEYKEVFDYVNNTNLNESKYDMIIMGFQDVASLNGGLQDISEKAVKQLEDYVKVGKSLMMTHDTLTYWTKGWDIEKYPYLMKTFRDVVGQSRYIDPNNQDELDFNGEKIEHDPNGFTVTEDKNEWDNEYMKEVGATFLNRGMSAGDTESTFVYKTNKSILTEYPFNLGTEIRVRKTHGQYFQLNLEDEDVVPIFNLTEINEKHEWYTRYSDNNKYDSRNYYYTYSRGNITFSGTGENSREWNEYPLEEMQLFVNTIVKAERSANHKPQISGLENIYEVSYNSDFNFNLIVKDVDGDKVKINKVLVNNIDISSKNNIPTELKDSGSSFPIVIEKNLLTLNNEMSIIIEAEDEKGAKAIKEYKIKPNSNAIINSKTVIIDTLVKKTESFKIELEKENDTNPTSINIESVNTPDSYGIYTLEDVKIVSEGEKSYLIGNVTSLVKTSGQEIPIIIKYNSGGSTKKETEIKIILNSAYKVEPIDIELHHGLYNGIENNEINIQENNNDEGFKIASESIVTFGAKFTLANSNIDFNLNIDKKFDDINLNEIKVYKIKDNTISEIVGSNKAILEVEKNKLKISLKNIKEQSDTSTVEILIIYKGKAKDSSEKFTNTIEVSGLSKDITIITRDESNDKIILPDLF